MNSTRKAWFGLRLAVPPRRKDRGGWVPGKYYAQGRATTGLWLRDKPRLRKRAKHGYPHKTAKTACGGRIVRRQPCFAAQPRTGLHAPAKTACHNPWFILRCGLGFFGPPAIPFFWWCPMSASSAFALVSGSGWFGRVALRFLCSSPLVCFRAAGAGRVAVLVGGPARFSRASVLLRAARWCGFAAFARRSPSCGLAVVVSLG